MAFNPVGKNSKTGVSAHFGADIALVTVNHPDYNGIEQLNHGDRKPFIISGPGDYEIKEIFIKGVLSEALLDGPDLPRHGGASGVKKKYINTIYLLSVDGINIAFLGALSGSDFSKESHEALSSPDILFIPVGGQGMLDAKSAAKLASSLEPKLIIPMDYDDASLKLFLKELGEEKAQAVEKLTIKRKDLDNKEGQVVILKAT